jgi:sigma-E factor negative regulatory protein RseA
MMKQKISVFMDGELFDDEAENCLDYLKLGSEARKNWAVYHLIGDVMRQPEHIPCDLSVAVCARVQSEPTVFAPRGHLVQHKTRSFALSAAATLAAVGVVAWMSLQINPEIKPQIPIQQAAFRPASMQFKSNANEYLMAHQEFSPSTDMNGGASYIRIVSYTPDGK